ncbi:PREDICTED: uncharacterized protein LOC109168038 isoform X2 [Ipomoea nil]|uniref:uncharacterized protein LOC109168038 isoform X2 n=1 Tax=Ipomoea nil TaxID=35883 RepID=UPI000901097A|nr:PREDICTED: uncharacterized protein LOC109168038 isoform X2 [Ipomoea nil]
MVRKNQDEKKLKLNQPILSVRRSSGKDDKRKIDDSSLHTVPQPVLYRSESKLDPVRSPGVVPFVWEESPGKPKDRVKPQNNNTTGRVRVVPRLPHGRVAKTNYQCFDNSEEECEISEAENDDEGYAESSKSKVLFVDCKAGSFKGSDEEPDRTSSETRDFVIGLFLPATKTMASETPLYVPGKPRTRKNVAKADRRPRLQLEPSGGWHCYQSHDCEDDEHKHETLFPAKACGVVPRLCVRSSIFILNPVPAMTVKTRVHTSPGSRQRYSFARSCTGLNDERPTSGLTKQKSQRYAHSEPPQTHEIKAVLPTQGFGANPRLDALRVCKKFSRKLQELLADHSGSTREDSSPVLGFDSPVTKMKPQQKPILDFSFRDKTKPFVQETVNFDMLTSGYESGRNPVKDYYGEADKRYELTITSLDSSDSEEEDERSIKQEALTRKLKQSQGMMHLEVPASPPLPKSPSDSWLFRTLPSLSTKTSPLRPYLSENPSSVVQSGDPHC